MTYLRKSKINIITTDCVINAYDNAHHYIPYNNPDLQTVFTAVFCSGNAHYYIPYNNHRRQL